MNKRAYRLGRRAESQDETRRRIVEATVDLHGTVGPRATTISAIAERAGVQRLTVYRHFPDDDALFAACSSHWQSGHPLPDPAVWLSQSDWRARCRVALGALFAYYRRNRAMLACVHRDADLPAVAARMGGFAAFNDRIRDDILSAAGPKLSRCRPFAATLGHVLAFATWQSLSPSVTDTAMVDLVMAWLDGAARQRPSAMA